MIGVLADPAQEEVVREFFELFKTPWEFYRKDRKYEVVLCSGHPPAAIEANLVVVYAGTRINIDDEKNLQTKPEQSADRLLLYKRKRLPLYGELVTFRGKDNGILEHATSHEAVAWIDRSGQGTLARVGYDLFDEVGRLLTIGQPSEHAAIPSLELHIAFLRDLITSCGLPLVEIPPIPEGYAFIACLTHDVDHPSIRKHKWDHTMLGFLYRAVVGSVRDVMRARTTLRSLIANWSAVLKLPFIHLGIAQDFWRNFDDQYLQAEKNLPSTFFFIPYKDRPGKSVQGAAPSFRASSYGAAELRDSIHKLLAAGCEVGVHGIDAWIDSESGRNELAEIRSLTQSTEIGVRMHWLYFDQESPVVLQKAGFSYDSTVGYNGAVGYRAGTSQAFKPLKATELLELPLIAMDTALFYPSHLGLSSKDGVKLLSQLLDEADQFGGCFTVNWHDRSLAPERNWANCYWELIEQLKQRKVWFATAQQATDWFRKRRSVSFETDGVDPNKMQVRTWVGEKDGLPGVRLFVHNSGKTESVGLVPKTPTSICLA